MFYKKTLGDKIFDAVVYFLVACVMIVTLYPLIYVFSMAISEPTAAAAGKNHFCSSYSRGFDYQCNRRNHCRNNSNRFSVILHAAGNCQHQRCYQKNAVRQWVCFITDSVAEEETGKQVIALPIEATALGNLKVQMEVTL